MTDELVAGESAETLLVALAHIEWGEEVDGMMSGSVRLEPELGRPFMRAMMRIEAELLAHDADAYGQPDVEERTPEQRAADAFVALTLRVSDALRVP
jgi:hypothetical protein